MNSQSPTLLRHLLVVFSIVAASLPFPVLRAVQAPLSEIAEQRTELAEEATTFRRSETPALGSRCTLASAILLEQRHSPAPVEIRMGAVPTGHFLANGHSAPQLI